MRKAFIMSLVAAAICVAATAQAPTGIIGEGKGALSLRVGMSPELVVSLSYGRGFALGGEGELFPRGQAHAGLAWRFAQPDPRDLSLELGFRPTIAAAGGWDGGLAVNVQAKFTDNRLFKGFALSTETGLVGGYCDAGPAEDPSWFGETAALYSRAWITRLMTKDVYKSYIYPEIKDGWFAPSASSWKFGAAFGVAQGSVSSDLAFGYRLINRFSIFAPPIYLTAGLRITD